MPINRKLIGAAAFSLALAGGGVAGAVLGTPSFSGATSTATAPSADDGTGEHWGPGPQGGAGLTVAAEAIGISEDDLRAALADGQSIAQAAEAEGVDVQTVVDALVADATTRLEDAIAELPDRIAEMVAREGLPGRGGPGQGHGGGHRGIRPALDVAAETIGITEDELSTQLQDGSTIAEVAEANDVEAATVIDALVTAAETHLDDEVAEGDLTEEAATARKAMLEELITAAVNGERPEGGPGHVG